MAQQRRERSAGVALESILLGVLLSRPSTGYDIKKYLDSYGRFLRSNTEMSQVYRVLQKMEKYGWVTHSVESRSGAQNAKRYEVTPEGITVFLDWLASPYIPPSRFQDPDFIVRLSFAAFMTPEQLLQLLDTELATRQAEIARYRYRSRSSDWAAAVPVNEALAEMTTEWSHQLGSRAMDMHVEHVMDLRKGVLEYIDSSRSAN